MILGRGTSFFYICLAAASGILFFSAVFAQEVSPTPAPSPTPTPEPTPTPSPTPVDGDPLAGPQVPDVPVPVPTPAITEDYADIEREVRETVERDQAAADRMDEALDIDPDPADTPLPDILGDEPYIPSDLVSPIPRPPTVVDQDTIRSSEQTLENLRRAAQAAEPSADVPELTLDQAVEFALQNNPGILESVQQIRQQFGIIVQVASQGLPQIVASSAYSIQQSTLSPSQETVSVLEIGGVTGTITSQSRIPQNQTWDVQIGVQQLLFDGGGVIAGVRAARALEAGTYFQLRRVIDDVIAAVKINFFQVILNRALIVAQEQSVALLESQLQDQINRFEAGTVPRFNVLQAEVALANSIPPLIQARNNLRISQYQLVRLMGMNYPADRLSQVPFNVVGELVFDYRDIDIEESIRVALLRSPLLKAQRYSILAQAQNVNVALSGYFPRIAANAGYQWRNNQSSQSLTETVEGWFFGVQGSWAIFDGLETVGAVTQAKAQLQQSKVVYDDGVRQVILNVQEAISNLQEARETIESQRASVAQATEALRLSRERLDAGAGTQLDVLNAQVQLLQAQTTELQARFDYISALAQYDAALSLDTRYEDYFEDPLNNTERRIFFRLNDPDRPQPSLPRVFRGQDPLEEELGTRPVPPAATVDPVEGPGD